MNWLLLQLLVSNESASCKEHTLFFLPNWYKYLIERGLTRQGGQGGCNITINNIYDIFLILAALIELVLRLGVLIAVGFIIYGGIKFIVSQGDPQGITVARNTIVNAVIGFIITLLAASIVSFIAGRF